MDFNNTVSAFASSAADPSAMDVDAPSAGPSNSGGENANASSSQADINGGTPRQLLHLSNGNSARSTGPPNPNLTFFYEDADADTDSVVEKGRMVRTGYIFDPLMMLHCYDGYVPTEDIHDSGEGHPEEPMRIKRIFNRLKEQGLIRRMKRLDFTEANFEQIRLVHTDNHWMKVQGTESESVSSTTCLRSSKLMPQLSVTSTFRRQRATMTSCRYTCAGKPGTARVCLVEESSRHADRFVTARCETRSRSSARPDTTPSQTSTWASAFLTMSPWPRVRCSARALPRRSSSSTGEFGAVRVS